MTSLLLTFQRFSRLANVGNELAVPTAIILIALALRFHHLGDTSLWLDEAVYANNARTSFWEFIRLTRGNNSSPILLPLLYWLCGETIQDPFLIRLMPAIFGSAAIVVVLLFSRVGIARNVAISSALWLACSPLQIEYSQEVREYSLSVLVTTILTWSFLGSLRYPRHSLYHRVFICALIAAPLSSYGNIFIAAIYIVGCLLGTLLNEKRVSKFGLWALVSFVFAVLASYLCTAHHQMGVANAAYLENGYPPGAFVINTHWALGATRRYFALGTSGRWGIPVAMLSCIGIIAAIFGKGPSSAERKVTLALGALLISSLGLSFLGLFPFGGLRQHLFATPLIVVTLVNMIASVIRHIRLPDWTLYVVVATCLLILDIRGLRRVYRENENIGSVVNAISPSVLDTSVFVYFAAVPAIDFHFSNRGFYRSRALDGDIAGMTTEVEALNGCNKALVFSHILRNDASALIQALSQNNYKIIDQRAFKGAKLYQISRCDGASP